MRSWTVWDLLLKAAIRCRRLLFWSTFYRVASLKTSSPAWKQLTMWSPEDLATLEKVTAKLKEFQQIASIKIEKPDDKLKALLVQWQNTIRQLPEGESILLPGGWNGTTAGSGWVSHILERTSSAAFRFYTCNGGNGLRYHSNDASSKFCKLKYDTCLRIDDVPMARATDLTFWTMMFSQWLVQSEFHRVEVLYDVLLPWLSGKNTLAEATIQREETRTPQRSGVSAWRSTYEGFRCLLMNEGISASKVKQLTFALLDATCFASHATILAHFDRRAARS